MGTQLLHSQITEFLSRSFWCAMDWVYPPVCVVCGEPGFLLCSRCEDEIKIRSGHICRICGSYISDKRSICEQCQQTRPLFTAMRTLADYEGVIRECVHALKYQKNQSLGYVFSQMLRDLLVKEGWELDMIIPVPLSPKRIVERGYNQAAQIARPLAAKLGVKYNPYGLRRIRNTRSQVGLSAQERRDNVAGAFEAVSDLVRRNRILVVDDVVTTGATLSACAEALRMAGADTVYCLTLAGYVEGNSASILVDHQV